MTIEVADQKGFGLLSSCLLHTDQEPVLLGIKGFVKDNDGKRVASSDAAELFRAFSAAKNAGELFKLILTIIPHRNGMKNKNFWRIDDAAYRSVAASAVGRPFLRDHDTTTTRAKGGKILSSKAKGKGEEAFMIQEVELSAGWAISDALRGVMDEFSIQLNHENVYCSICNQRVWKGNQLVWEFCHVPGYTYDIEGKGKVTAWWIAGKGTTLKETSEVVDPAVAGTGIEQIKQLAASCGRTITLPTKEETMNEEELKALLASKEEELKAKDAELLAATATMDEAKQSIEKASSDLKAAQEQGQAFKTQAIGAQKRLCFDLLAQIGHVRESADLFAGQEAVAVTIPDDADFASIEAQEKNLRCTLLTDQILVERDKRNLKGPGLTVDQEQEAIKAERSRLMEKSPEVLAEVLAEVRLQPVPGPTTPMGRGSTTQPTQEDRAAVLAMLNDRTGVPATAEKKAAGIDEFDADSIAKVALGGR